MSKKVFVLMLLISAAALASSIRVTDGVSSGGKVIWVEAENYDSKTAEFVADPDVLFASGSAMYCPSYSPNTTTEQWWMEYSIDSADPQLAGVSLSGTWYFWARLNQPQSNAEEADWLFVKGDPGDGGGTTWYADALATAGQGTVDGDIIANNVSGRGGAGAGKWAWIGAGDSITEGRAKQFNLDGGKITFRINEREGGPNNARIDAVCWSNEPNFVPTDAIFGQTIITDGLVFMMDASRAGNKVNTNWKPLVGPVTATGDLNPAPAINSESAGADLYRWYYTFTPAAAVGDKVTNLGGDTLVFNHDVPHTIEVWARVPSIQTPDSAGRGVWVGTAEVADTGWRYGPRNIDGTFYSPEYMVRDNETAVTPRAVGTLSLRVTDVANKRAYSATDWHQFVFSRKVAYDATLNRIEVRWTAWTDGVRTRNETLATLALQAGETIESFAWETPTMETRIGQNGTTYPYTGDIAAVRVYNRILTDADVAANFAMGINTTIASQCGGEEFDYTGDCAVDLADFAEFAQDWLFDATVYGATN